MEAEEQELLNTLKVAKYLFGHFINEQLKEVPEPADYTTLDLWALPVTPFNLWMLRKCEERTLWPDDFEPEQLGLTLEFIDWFEKHLGTICCSIVEQMWDSIVLPQRVLPIGVSKVSIEVTLTFADGIAGRMTLSQEHGDHPSYTETEVLQIMHSRIRHARELLLEHGIEYFRTPENGVSDACDDEEFAE